jgi:excisionase family DNA binding protein
LSELVTVVKIEARQRMKTRQNEVVTVCHSFKMSADLITMTKKEAAELLGVTERTLERYTSQNRIGVRYEKGKTSDVAAYDRGELERFKAELERPTHRPAIQRMSSGNEIPTNIVNHDSTALSPLASFDVIERIITATASATVQAIDTTRDERPAVEIADKVLLTLLEAQALCGLSRAVLKTAIDAGELKAQTIGRAWRVKRSDLDKWIEGL